MLAERFQLADGPNSTSKTSSPADSGSGIDSCLPDITKAAIELVGVPDAATGKRGTGLGQFVILVRGPHHRMTRTRDSVVR